MKKNVSDLTYNHNTEYGAIGSRDNPTIQSWYDFCLRIVIFYCFTIMHMSKRNYSYFSFRFSFIPSSGLATNSISWKWSVPVSWGRAVPQKYKPPYPKRSHFWKEISQKRIQHKCEHYNINKYWINCKTVRLVC